MRPEEIILIKELRNKNKVVFEGLFRQYYKLLRKVSMNYVFDQQVAEDIIQGFFVHLWENADHLYIKHTIKTYFIKAIRNRSLNYLRDKKIADRHELLYMELILSLQEEELIKEEELHNELLRVVSSLPDGMAEIFILKYYEGLKIDEISKRNDISPNTVKTQIRRAKDKLLKLLRP